MTTPQLSDKLLRYHAERERQRADEVRRTLNALSPREQQLVCEAAVMAYVRGVMAGRVGDYDIPTNSAILAEVVDAALAMPDLYPAINSVANDRPPSGEATEEQE